MTYKIDWKTIILGFLPLIVFGGSLFYLPFESSNQGVLFKKFIIQMLPFMLILGFFGLYLGIDKQKEIKENENSVLEYSLFVIPILVLIVGYICVSGLILYDYVEDSKPEYIMPDGAICKDYHNSDYEKEFFNCNNGLNYINPEYYKEVK